MAALRLLAPLVGLGPEQAPTVHGRARAALERDKALTLRAIKELEFDRAMGKVAEPDFVEMRGAAAPARDAADTPARRR